MGRSSPISTAALTEPTDAAPRRFLSSYRELMDVPGFWRLAAIGMASKLAPSMVGLSLLLLVSQEGYSYATAGGGAVGAAVFAYVAADEGSRTALLLVPAVALLAAVAGWNSRARKPKP